MCVGLDEFPDGETVRRFNGGDRNVFAHVLVSVSQPDKMPLLGNVVLNKTALSENRRQRRARVAPRDPL
jgi:hypothetical protein